MSSATLAQSGSRFGNRHVAAVGVLGITLLAAVLLSLFAAEQAVGGDLLERAVIPARMFLLVAVATLLLKAAGETWSGVGLRRPGSYWRVAALVLAGYLAVGLMFVAVSQLLAMFGVSSKTLGLFAAIEGNTAEYLYWLIPVAWGSAAIGEELVFRGFIQTRLEAAAGSVKAASAIAVVGQALIFGALHYYQGLGGAILAGATGLVIGIVYLAGRRNLWAPIILHGLVDTVTLTAVYYGVAGTAS